MLIEGERRVTCPVPVFVNTIGRPLDDVRHFRFINLNFIFCSLLFADLFTKEHHEKDEERRNLVCSLQKHSFIFITKEGF